MHTQTQTNTSTPLSLLPPMLPLPPYLNGQLKYSTLNNKIRNKFI